MSAARVTRSRTRTVSAVADLPVEKVAAPPAKKRKTQPKTKAEPVVVVPPPLPIAKYTPTAFNLDHAVSHLTSVDVRFATLFERIPCKPFLAAASEQSVAGAALAVAAAPEETETNGSTAAPQVDPFASLVKSIIGQQVSWQSARSITKRFVEHFCGPTDASGDEMRSGKGPFPTCEQVAASDVAALKGVGCSTRKAEYLIELAQQFASGQLTNEFLLNAPDEEVAKALIAVRGIGRWTVDMFLIFTLKRPDVLPVGDLGVQKGLLRWVLAAHGALDPPKAPKTPKKSASASTATPVTPSTPKPLAPSASEATLLNEPATPTPDLSQYNLVTPSKFPSTPAPPPVTPSASANPLLPPPVESILATPVGWSAEHAHKSAPLPDGLNVGTLKSRLAGKKAKGGAYLLPEEMEALTQAWRPYRSLGVYYTWSMLGEGGTA